MNNLGIGTWKIGDNKKMENEEITSIRYAIDYGIRLIDTAQMYGNGNSERLIGKAIKPYKRDELFLVSKILPSHAGKDKIYKACEESLKNLNTDYLDLYLLHWRGNYPLSETIECFEELKRMGKIKNWGVSNMDTQDLKEILSISKNCATNQVLYHLGSRGIEYSLKPLMDKNNIYTMAYCPLAQAGKLKSTLLTAKSVNLVAIKHNITPIQVLLCFVLSQKNMIAIPKAAKLEHMKEIIKCKDIKLTSEDLTILENEFPKPNKKLPLDIE